MVSVWLLRSSPPPASVGFGPNRFLSIHASAPVSDIFGINSPDGGSDDGLDAGVAIHIRLLSAMDLGDREHVTTPGSIGHCGQPQAGGMEDLSQAIAFGQPNGDEDAKGKYTNAHWLRVSIALPQQNR